MVQKLVIDFESFWDTKNGYTLKKMSMLEYVRDPRFKVHGVGYVRGNNEGWAEPSWVSQKGTPIFLASVDWSDTDVIMHNAKFDGLILKEKFGIQPRSWIDTKGMSRAIHGKSIPDHSLSTIAKYYGLEDKGVMRTDGIRDLTAEQEKELAEYCLHDVELAAQIYSLMTNKFPQNQNEILSRTIQMFVDPKLKLDVELLEKTTEEERQRKLSIFSDIQIDKAEFASNIKFPRLLEKEGYEVPKKLSPRTGKEIAAIALGDPDFLDMLESGNERLQLLCEARVAAKSTLLETRSEKLAKLGRTGLWSFDVEFSGANQTHRFSGGKGAGGNPQNFTRGSALRKAVCAPDGYRLIVGDFSNIELRLVAYLSKDPGLVEAIKNDRDLYCDLASTFYGRTITKADKIERGFGKCAILGLGYGMGAAKFKRTVRLQTGLDISDAEAERAVDLYRSRYPYVPQLWYTLNSSIPALTRDQEGSLIGLPIRFRKNALILPSGLEMQYPKLRLENDEWIYDTWGKAKDKPERKKLYGGKILENIAQGLAGELCKEVAQQFGDLFVGQVHDEIHLLVRAPLAEVFKKRLEIAMTTPPKWMDHMKLKAEVGVGKNWLEAK